MAESDDRIFSSLPTPGDGAIGGFWDAEFQVPRPYGHRANHEAWHGKFFVSRDHPHAELVRGAAFIGDAYGPPSREGLDDNVVLPGHAPNCKCQLRLVYDIHELPRKYRSWYGSRAIRRGLV